MELALQGLLTCLAVAASAAAAGAMPEERQRCIALSRIDSVDVLDNKRIVFEMVGGGYCHAMEEDEIEALRRAERQ